MPVPTSVVQFRNTASIVAMADRFEKRGAVGQRDDRAPLGVGRLLILDGRGERGFQVHDGQDKYIRRSPAIAGGRTMERSGAVRSVDVRTGFWVSERSMSPLRISLAARFESRGRPRPLSVNTEERFSRSKQDNSSNSSGRT